MRFYTKRHKFYCGIDIHARFMYLCIQDGDSKVIVHKNIKAEPTPFLDAIEPYMEDVVMCAECTLRHPLIFRRNISGPTGASEVHQIMPNSSANTACSATTSA